MITRIRRREISQKWNPVVVVVVVVWPVCFVFVRWFYEKIMWFICTVPHQWIISPISKRNLHLAQNAPENQCDDAWRIWSNLSFIPSSDQRVLRCVSVEAIIFESVTPHLMCSLFFFCWILCKNPQICQDIIVRATICQSWSYVYIFFLLDFVFRNRRSVGRIIPCNVPRFGQRAFWAQVDRSAASLETESQGRR